DSGSFAVDFAMTDFYPWNFLGLSEDLSDYGSSKVVVLPIPYDATVSYGDGARNGPRAIISASRQVETYDNDFGNEPCQVGIATTGELERESSGPEAMMIKIEKAASEIIDDGKFLLTLGGEHSITSPLVKVYKDKFPDLSVLQIDAHTDLREEYQGSRYSHACVMSRVGEICEFVSVGIRGFCNSENERKAIRDGRIIESKVFHKNPDAVSLILSLLTDRVYITFDLDGFDPSVMPAVGTPEPGGLLWEEAIELIMAVGRSKDIVGCDVVELAPIPGMIYPDFTAARLAYKLIGSAFSGRE
ncbi:MAG: agmatinase, partial [candidate division Zixibacteria bacterium]